jgi:chemotaxis protein MotB
MITMRWGARAAGIAALIALSLSAASCGVSKTKYADLNKNYDQAVSKNKELQASLDAANKDKEQLQSEKSALEQTAKDHEAMAQQLGTKLAEQQKSVEDMKATYESLVGNLKGELDSGKLQVQQLRDGISVNLAQDILFKSGSANLDKSGKELLLKVSDQLKASPFQILVTGHTDNQKIGPALAARYPTNWELGGARAAVIVRLFEGAGIGPERLAAVSFADSRPRESNDTPAGREKNRRIEIRLRPVSTEQSAGGDQ